MNAARKTQLKIDFVSDVSCPWCVIGLRAMEKALAELGEVEANVRFKPFELNPDMVPEGQDLVEHIEQKYGTTPEQSAATRKMIRERGAELGFIFDQEKYTRIYNTFDTHRLLHWADTEGKQYELKTALFKAYFTEGLNPGAHDVLVTLAANVGLDRNRAEQILLGDEFAAEVRAEQAFYQRAGIHAVPAVVVNDKHLIQGGQPVEVFKQAFAEIAKESHSESA
ncbi:MAG: DsbA family oxidoreductase [Gammaproteobacteria bacterium]